MVLSAVAGFASRDVELHLFVANLVRRVGGSHGVDFFSFMIATSAEFLRLKRGLSPGRYLIKKRKAAACEEFSYGYGIS